MLMILRRYWSMICRRNAIKSQKTDRMYRKHHGNRLSAISFDITAGGVHKGNAIKAVLQSLHLKKEEFMAFGDAMNDLPMFAEAGLTVAMANAAEEIQASCDIVTADYMDDGVAKAIQRYIL